MAKGKRANRADNSEVAGRPDNKPGNEGTSDKQTRTFEYDRWQQEVLDTKGKSNIALRAGRQVGKSTVIAALAGNTAVENKDFSIMIISATERQAFLLFSKVLLYLDDNFRGWIKQGKDRPTKSEIKLKNGSIIRCLPTGLDGLGIRGYTINLLIADEAAFIGSNVWPAVIPGLTTTGGKIILLSTPFGKKGYFYDCYYDNSFKTWHISAEDVANSRPEPQRTFMLDHQEKQKLRMTRLQYAQEYLGEFVSALRQIFSDELIAKTCVLTRKEVQLRGKEYYLGVDIARLGEDQSTFEILEKIDDNNIMQRENKVTTKQLTTATHDEILRLNDIYNFKQIGIDAGSGSLGVGILDFLIRDPIIKRKVVALNNLSRAMDANGDRKRQLLKEDMYMNMLALMEKGILKLLNDDELIASLRAMQYEYVITTGKKTSVRIFASEHSKSDICEGLVRASWLANQKHLNCFISYI